MAEARSSTWSDGSAISARLMLLARKNAAVYAAWPETLAVAVTGSVAAGEADTVSDIDTLVFYRTMPTDADFERLRAEAGGSERLFFVGDAASGCAEGYYVKGVKCDFAHTTPDLWAADMAAVLERFDPASPYQKALDGTLHCVPLHGAPLIEDLRARAARYPEGLARSMVVQHSSFYPRWILERMAAARGDMLWFTQMLVEAENNLVALLFGLNRVYHWGELKRMDRRLATLALAPDNLATRLKRILRAEPGEAVRDLYALVEESLALVAAHMPDVDLSAVRRRLDMADPAATRSEGGD